MHRYWAKQPEGWVLIDNTEAGSPASGRLDRLGFVSTGPSHGNEDNRAMDLVYYNVGFSKVFLGTRQDFMLAVAEGQFEELYEELCVKQNDDVALLNSEERAEIESLRK